MNEQKGRSVREKIQFILRRQVRVQDILLIMVAEAGVLLGAGYLLLDNHRQMSALLDPHLGVDTFVGAVRDEIEKLESNEDETNKTRLFRLKGLELELNFLVRGTNKGKGEFKTEVVTVGTELETARERGQKIVLHMEVAPPRTMMIQPSPMPLSEEGGVELLFVPRKDYK